jgi:hypothetical protein
MDFYNYVRFFTIYFLVSMAVLALPTDIPFTTRQFFLVVIFYVAILVYARLLQLKKWLNLLSFLFSVSVLMSLPDYVFIHALKVFEYTDKDSLRIGDIPVYIFGIWIIPFSIILLAAELISQKYSKKWILNIFLIVGSFLLFTYIEATTQELPAWYYHGVKMYDNIAVYTILPNTLLAIIVYYGYKFCEHKSLFYRIITAFATVLVNFAILCLSYYAIEKLGLF